MVEWRPETKFHRPWLGSRRCLCLFSRGHRWLSRILQALQNDARTTNRQLANSVGLAASSCLERVRKLESTGVLRGYHADVDPDALGVGMLALIGVLVWATVGDVRSGGGPGMLQLVEDETNRVLSCELEPASAEGIPARALDVGAE